MFNSKNFNNQRSYVYQIGKGLLLFGGGILGYLGLSKIFSSEQQDEHNQVSTNEIVPYESNKLTLSDFESTFEPTLLSNFNSNPAGRKLLSIDDSEEQQPQQRRSGFTGIPGYRWTDEFQLNSYTTSDQGFSGGLAVTSLGEDKFVGVWNSNGQDGDGCGVFGRIFNVTGYPLTGEFQLNSYTTSDQSHRGLAIASLADGKFVGLWNSYGQDGSGYGVFGRVFNAAGYPLTGEFQLNSYTTSNQCYYYGLAVTTLADGKFVGLWDSDGQDGDGYGVFGRIFNSTGYPLTDEFQLNSYTTLDQGYQGLAVTALADGKFVGLWNSYGQDGSGYGVFGRIFNATGYPLTPEFQLNSYTISNQGCYGLTVTVLSDDKFVGVWNSYGQDGSEYGVFGRVFNATGYPLTPEFQLNSYTTLDQGYSLAVTALADGKFVGLWNSYGQDGDATGVFGRIFTATGYPLTPKFQLNSYTTSEQNYIAVTTLANSKFIGLWNSNSQDGSGYGVFGRIFTQNNCPILLNNKLTVGKNKTVTVNNNMILTHDTEDGADNLIITARNIAYGRFESIIQPGVSINDFTQQEVNTNRIRFVHDGSNNPPSYEISVSDGFCTTLWSNASVTFNLETNPNVPPNFPYEYLIIGGGIAFGICVLCAATTCIMITATSICVAKNLKPKSVTEDEVELLDTSSQLGDFLAKYQVPHNEIEVIKHIGTGASATVYKAKWENKEVAYKVFPVIDTKKIKDFETEAKIMLESNHPNIVRLYRVCIKQGTFGLLMEYMEMGTLKDVLSKKKVKLNWSSKWNIAYDLASVLKFLHSKNVFHRDIKTDNVLLYKEGNDIHAKIADFGLSKTQETEQSVTMAVGTYKYMAPEMVLGDERYGIGKFPMDKVDVYALGMTYVTLIIEQEPYSKEKNSMNIPARVSRKELMQKLPEDKCPFMFFSLTNRCRDLDLEKRPPAGKIVEELKGMKKHVINFVPQ